MKKHYLFTSVIILAYNTLAHAAHDNFYLHDDIKHEDCTHDDEHEDDHDVHTSVQLEEMVVSANKSLVNRKDAPVVVNLISSKFLEQVNAPDLAKTLSYQSGLRV